MTFPCEHKLLPAQARAILQEAAKTPIPQHDPLARVKAIEKAVARIKLQHPGFFRQEG